MKRVLLYCLVGISVILSSAGANPFALESLSKPTLAPLIKKVMPAVVNISAKKIRYRHHPFLNDPFFQHFFGRQFLERREAQSIGSGVIIDASQGLIATNYHVVENAEDIYVSLMDGRQIPATLKGSDHETDLAFLEIKAKDLVGIEFADSDKLEVGDFAIAIGNPFGLGHSVTLGIISALGRTGLGIRDIENFIQTDAPINPGNSGGALIDLEGKLIGLNTAILAGGGGNLGIGFATPSKMVMKVFYSIKKYGYVKRGTLGAEFQDLERDIVHQLGLKTQEGAIITTLYPDSPGKKIGLHSGDVILEYGGVKIKNATHLRTLVSLSTVGEKEEMKIFRDGKILTKTVVLQEQPKAVSFDMQDSYLRGISFTQMNGVVVVTQVNPDASIVQLGLQKGDIIESINGRPIKKVEDVQKALAQKSAGISLKIRRGHSMIVMSIG